MKIILLLSITLYIVFSQNSYGLENSTTENPKLVEILERYWQWWSNSPEDNPDNDPKCSIDFDRKNSFIYLQNPFGSGNTNYDCTENPIPHGYYILFPLITSFCSQGDVGLKDKPYEEVRNCVLNLDRGTIKGKVMLDGNEIVNLFIDNGNGIDIVEKKQIVNNLPDNRYYKEIFSQDFVDILATNNTIHINNWENDEYKSGAVYYKGVVHCDCIIINTRDMEVGTHSLEYLISANAKPLSQFFIADQWDFTSNTNYKLKIQ
jgi:hypothetical protein